MALTILTAEQIDRIHAASLEILETIGIEITHEQARKLLRERGCSLQDKRAYLPHTLVEDVLQQCPKSFTVYNRDASLSYEMALGKLYFQNASQIPFVIEMGSGKRREARMQDLIDSARLLDALPHYDFISPLVTPKDVAPR